MACLPLGLLLSLALPASAHLGHPAPERHRHILAQGEAAEARPAVEIGHCVGEGRPLPPPAKTPPYDLKLPPLSAESEQFWKLLDHKIDRARGRLLDPAGAELSAAEVAFAEGEVDAGWERVDSAAWIVLQGEGFTLDETSCRLIGKKKTLTRLRLRIYALAARKSNEAAALEKLRAMLAGADPSRPLPAEFLKTLDRLKHSGLAIPAELERKLRSDQTSAALAAAQLDEARAASARFWEAQSDKLAPFLQALPAIRDVTVPPKGPDYDNDAQQRLGRALLSDVEAMLGEVEPGRELLARLRGPDGKGRLPPIAIAKLSQRPDDANYGRAYAVYDPSRDRMVLNYWNVASTALEAAPREERARLAKDFADPAKLELYLLGHPSARKAFLETCEGAIVHEYVHAWQNRRKLLNIEMARGNAPSSIPIENEHEAFREQGRYFHAKLLKDPAKAVNSQDLQSYMGLLASYDQFRDGITAFYSQNFAAGLDLPTMAEVHSNRFALTARLRREASSYARAFQQFGIGFWGTLAVAEHRIDVNEREKKFLETQWPAMRKEGYGALYAQYSRSGEQVEALRVAVAAPFVVAQEERLALQEKVSQRLLKGEIEVHELPSALGALEQALTPERIRKDAALSRAMSAGHAAVADAYGKMAEIEKDPALKKQLRELVKEFEQAAARYKGSP